MHINHKCVFFCVFLVLAAAASTLNKNSLMWEHGTSLVELSSQLLLALWWWNSGDTSLGNDTDRGAFPDRGISVIWKERKSAKQRKSEDKEWVGGKAIREVCWEKEEEVGGEKSRGGNEEEGEKCRIQLVCWAKKHHSCCCVLNHNCQYWHESSLFFSLCWYFPK